MKYKAGKVKVFSSRVGKVMEVIINNNNNGKRSSLGLDNVNVLHYYFIRFSVL